VVKSRLALAGLDGFVLELHSNKANKKRVLKDLDERLRLRAGPAAGLPALLEQQERKRRDLKAYADLLNTVLGNHLDLTLHQVMWRSELNRLRCGACAEELTALHYPPAPSTDLGQLAVLCELLSYLAAKLDSVGDYGPAHPLWSFFPAEFKSDDHLPVQQTLSAFAERFALFAGAMFQLTELVADARFGMAGESARALVPVLSELLPQEFSGAAFEILPRLFTSDDPSGVRARATLEALASQAAVIAAGEADAARYLIRTTPASEHDATSASEAFAGLKLFGLQACTAQELAVKRATLGERARAVAVALDELAEVASLAGLAFDRSETAVRQIVAVGAVVEGAPTVACPRWMTC
jgi:hypothetical protein